MNRYFTISAHMAGALTGIMRFSGRVLTAAIFLFMSTPSSGDGTSGRPNILVILIDTLRPDSLSCYGYPEIISPNIDTLSKESTLFTGAYTVCPWTNPTVASIFTGRYPEAIFPPKIRKIGLKQMLPEKSTTLAELLYDAEYRTVILSDHPGISSALNYDKGFTETVWFFKTWRKGSYASGSKQTVILEGLKRKLGDTSERPFFFYMHLIYPHWPYSPPPEFNKYSGEKHPTRLYWRDRDKLRYLYEGEIKYTDRLIGHMISILKEQEQLDDTWIIITADHGEGFWEHRRGEHGNSLYNELLKIPLIIRPPGGEKNGPIVVSGPVSIIDLFPTVLDIAGITPPPDTEGTSLLKYVSGDLAPYKNRILFSSHPHSAVIKGVSCVRLPLKFIFTPCNNWYLSPQLPMRIKLIELYLRARNTFQLYDIEKDPAEKHNIAYLNLYATKRMAILAFKYKLVNMIKRSEFRKKEGKFDKNAERELRSLGYLQ